MELSKSIEISGVGALMAPPTPLRLFAWRRLRLVALALVRVVGMLLAGDPRTPKVEERVAAVVSAATVEVRPLHR
jgi:hypothetical protein